MGKGSRKTTSTNEETSVSSKNEQKTLSVWELNRKDIKDIPVKEIKKKELTIKLQRQRETKARI